MNVASSLRLIYSSPLGSFLPLPNPRGYLDAPDLAHCDDGPPVPNLGSVTECGWRLEGSTHFGTQLYAVPVALLPNLPPIHVDIIIPDQTQWAPELWAKLDASRSSHMTDGRFNQLGIAKHVLRVLGHWSSSIFDFQEQYLALPFSSSIIIGEIIPNIEDTPSPVATIKEPGTDISKVCGFVLKFYPGPNFEIGLKQKNRDGTLLPADQLRWAKDIAKALIHISKSPVKFASDLKMDNIMMTTVDGQETAVLIDFEQSRNTFSWAPTEIYLIECLAIVANASRVPPSVRDKYTKLLQEYCASRGVDFLTMGKSNFYDNPPTGWYLPWVASTEAEQEAGNVCLVGKVIWCIFEGVGNINVALRSSKPDNEKPEFPTFIKSPPAIQDLIKSCTEGSREWTEGLLGLTRNGSKIYPRGKSGQDGEKTASLDETRVAIQAVWSSEIKKGEAFVEARMRHDKGVATAEDAQRLRYLNRPKLTEVLARLEEITL